VSSMTWVETEIRETLVNSPVSILILILDLFAVNSFHTRMVKRNLGAESF